MVYLEKQERNKKKYYYIVKNIRLKNNKWKKVRIYLGSKEPSKEDLENAEEKIEKTEIKKTKYLDKQQVENLNTIKRNYKKYLKKLTPQDFINFEDATLTSFTYNTNTIEGSTLDMQEVGLILEKGITPAGKDLREVYGVTNMREAFNFIKKMRDITEENIKKIHYIVMKNILSQDLGNYRTVPVRIIGSKLKLPFPQDVQKEMKSLIKWYNENSNLHPFELACILHIKFEKVHPFRDGNGRVGRLLMNFILLKEKYPLLDIKADRKIIYYRTLEKAQLQRKYKDFIDYALDTYIKDAKTMQWI